MKEKLNHSQLSKADMLDNFIPSHGIRLYSNTVYIPKDFSLLRRLGRLEHAADQESAKDAQYRLEPLAATALSIALARRRVECNDVGVDCETALLTTVADGRVLETVTLVKDHGQSVLDTELELALIIDLVLVARDDVEEHGAGCLADVDHVTFATLGSWDLERDSDGLGPAVIAVIVDQGNDAIFLDGEHIRRITQDGHGRR